MVPGRTMDPGCMVDGCVLKTTGLAVILEAGITRAVSPPSTLIGRGTTVALCVFGAFSRSSFGTRTRALFTNFDWINA